MANTPLPTTPPQRPPGGHPAFGRSLKRLRRRAGFTQEALSERAGYSTGYIGMLERGERMPLPQTVEVLAGALGLAADERAQLQAAAQSDGAPHQRRFEPDAAVPLVGRAAELALLERHLVGEGPPVLMLAGEPGMGKTRLLDEASRCAALAGWTVLRGDCPYGGAGGSYAPLLDALERHLRRLRRPALRTALRGCSWLERLLPEVEMLGAGPRPTWTPPPERERRLLFTAVARLLRNVAGPAGTLLVLDDLQWAGPDALELLVTLTHASADAGDPLRVVGAYRHTDVRSRAPLAMVLADLSRARLATEHTLSPLTAREARLLLETALQDQLILTPERLEHLVQRVGGVPFFIVSYAHGMRAGFADAADPHVPWTLAQSIRQRIALLSEAALDTLQLAAVTGREIRRRLLVSALARPETEVLEAVEAVCHARLLEESGDGYRFVHDVVREAIAADLGALRRAVLHRRVAEAIEQLYGSAAADLLALHFAQADLPERALPYLEQAADRARDHMAHGAAADQYRALAERLEQVGRARDAVRAREKLGMALAAQGRYGAAIDALEVAATAYLGMDDTDGAVRVLAYVGHLHMRRGTAGDGITRLREAIHSLTGVHRPPGPAALYATLAELFFVNGRYAEQIEVARQASAAARASGDERTLAIAEGRRGVALLLLGDLDAALPVLEGAARIAEAAADLDSLCRALTNLGVIHFIRGEFDRAQPYRERALEVARRQGDPFSIIRTLANRGEGALYAGDWARARDDFTEALAQAEQIDETIAAAYPLLDLALLCRVEGRWQDMERHVDAATRLAERSGDLQALRWAACLLAERDILRGEPVRAVARLQPVRDRSGLEETDVTYLLPTLAWALLESGDATTASAAAVQAVQRARAQRHQVTLIEALRVHALAASCLGQWDLAASCIDEGLALAGAMPYPYATARLLHLSAIGCALPGPGATAAAGARLQSALALYARLGARADEAQACRDLAALPYTQQLLAAGIVVTAGQWIRLEAILLPTGSRGRPRADNRRTLAAILYVRRTGCSWGALPAAFGDDATAHRRFQRWQADGTWAQVECILAKRTEAHTDDPVEIGRTR